MNDETEIYLKCNLCKNSHKYEYSNSEFSAIAIDWNSSDENFHLLITTPKINKKYIINLHPPLTIKTNVPFWAVYMNPNSSLNGIENEKDIKDIRFCKCHIIKTLELNETSASVEIEVIEIKKIDELIHNIQPNIQWKTLLDDEDLLNRYGWIENFKLYSYISVNIESDLGIDAIIKKENNSSRIVAINQWDFHLNEWKLCRIPLSKEDEIKYGIQ